MGGERIRRVSAHRALVLDQSAIVGQRTGSVENHITAHLANGLDRFTNPSRQSVVWRIGFTMQHHLITPILLDDDQPPFLYLGMAR